MKHSTLVASLSKSGHQIIHDLTPDQAELLHMAVGVSGEAGELLDAIKKHAIYGKPLDVTNVIEELGDIEFYMERIRQICRVSRAEVIKGNTEKLQVRYGAKYSNEAAQSRKDKQ